MIRRVLELLGDGEIHSGEKLGDALGISRAAVWKQLQKLGELGIDLRSVKGIGYRIPGGLELLRREAILEASTIPDLLRHDHVIILDSVDSTNNYLKKNFEGRYANGIVCLAEQQTNGRGRRGRTWISPFGRNLYFSTLWTFNGGASALDGLSLAVAVAVRRALCQLLGTEDILLKWPNDLLLGRRKVGGILLEMLGDPADFCQVVVGVGINAGMAAEAATADTLDRIDQPWADICEIGPISRNCMAAALVNHLLPLLNTYQLTGFSPYKQEWAKADAFNGAMIRLLTPAETIVGRSLGVADNGALRVDVGGREQSFFGGEISLRPNE